MLQQICAHTHGVCCGLIHLVDGHNDRNACRLGVADRFNGLGHHAIVSGHYKNGNVSGFGTARAHGRKGFVARRIDKGDKARGGFNLVSADMLRNAAGFARNHIGFANSVKQRSFAVVNVAHDGHNRWARDQIFIQIIFAIKAFNHVSIRYAFDLVAHFFSDDLGCISINQIIDGVHLALLHQQFDNVDSALGHAV